MDDMDDKTQEEIDKRENVENKVYELERLQVEREEDVKNAENL
jgi:hypothetical protein